jgi:ubiquinone/menaquinone biosynthesis C-methylase UbiE
MLSMEAKRFPNARAYLRQRGPLWTTLYAVRRLVTRPLDSALGRIERRRFILGPSTISSSHNTSDQNLDMWTEWDWSHSGEEWTEHASLYKAADPMEWKARLVEDVMYRFVPESSTVLEIGPGAGRWTEYLASRCDRVIAADITPRCLDLCRERFADRTNISYELIVDGSLGFVPDGSLDAIWSYDVFVHINPNDTHRYLEQFPRILKPGGRAVIHHPGTYKTEKLRRQTFRSQVDGQFFAHMAKTVGLWLQDQSGDRVHYPGDLISVVQRPSD